MHKKQKTILITVLVLASAFTASAAYANLTFGTDSVSSGGNLYINPTDKLIVSDTGSELTDIDIYLSPGTLITAQNQFNKTVSNPRNEYGFISNVLSRMTLTPTIDDPAYTVIANTLIDTETPAGNTGFIWENNGLMVGVTNRSDHPTPETFGANIRVDSYDSGGSNQMDIYGTSSYAALHSTAQDYYNVMGIQTGVSMVENSSAAYAYGLEVRSYTLDTPTIGDFNFINITSILDGTPTITNLRAINIQVLPNLSVSGVKQAINYADKFIVDAAGNIQLGVINTTAPASGECDAAGETGKVYWDSTNDFLYICSGASGWRKLSTTSP